MKAYVKKNLVSDDVSPQMHELEGTIIDVVWNASHIRGYWRSERAPYWLWDDDWLMILPDGCDLAKAVEVNIKWYDTWKDKCNDFNLLRDDYEKLQLDINNKDKEIATLKDKLRNQDLRTSFTYVNLLKLEADIDDMLDSINK